MKAEQLYQRALTAELAAIALLDEPKGTGAAALYRSAAWLALDCQNPNLAAQLAAKGLRTGPHPDVIAELQHILDQIAAKIADSKLLLPEIQHAAKRIIAVSDQVEHPGPDQEAAPAKLRDPVRERSLKRLEMFRQTIKNSNENPTGPSREILEGLNDWFQHLQDLPHLWFGLMSDTKLYALEISFHRGDRPLIVVWNHQDELQISIDGDMLRKLAPNSAQDVARNAAPAQLLRLERIRTVTPALLQSLTAACQEASAQNAPALQTITKQD